MARRRLERPEAEAIRQQLMKLPRPSSWATRLSPEDSVTLSALMAIEVST